MVDNQRITTLPMPFGVLLIAYALITASVSNAQLVADGQTLILDAVSTNVTGNLVVGTNAPFAMLVLTNGAALTNIGNATIGTNITANSNMIAVAGAGSIWNCRGGITVGEHGSYNQLVVNDGTVTNNFCYIGNDTNSSYDTITVAGTNALFACQQGVVIGNYGSFHQFTASNAATIFAGNNDSDLGGQGGNRGHDNAVTITGPGTQWLGQGLLRIGYVYSQSNHLTISNGGKMANLNCQIFGTNNSVLVTDAGSLFTNISVNFGVGPLNQVTISNGGVMAGFFTRLDGMSNLVVIDGQGSTCTNSDSFSMYGSFNQVVVENGGTIYDQSGYIGANYQTPRPDHNTCTVTGPGSAWVNYSNLWIGYAGSFNQLIVSNSANMMSDNGYLGGTVGSTSSSNAAVVTGAGSAWTNRRDLLVGNVGSFQSVLVRDGATLTASNVYLGFSSGSVGNILQLDNGNLIVASPAATSAIDIRRGVLILNSGLVVTDFLKADSGPSGQIQFNGGVIKTRVGSISNGLPLMVGDGTRSATINLMQSGPHVFADGLVVSSNGVLTDGGAIVGDVTILSGGTLAFAASISQCSLKGNLVLSNGSRTMVNLNAADHTNDNFTGMTSVAFGGTLALTNLAGTLMNGDLFRIFAAGAYSGAFTNVSPDAPGPGLKWNLNQLLVDGTLRVLAVTSAPPVIASIGLHDTSLVVSAGAGVPYDPVYLLTSTNVGAPPSNWLVLFTNRFDGSGNTSFTNVLTSDEPQRYFRLRLQ